MKLTDLLVNLYWSQRGSILIQKKKNWSMGGTYRIINGNYKLKKIYLIH